MLGFKSFNGVRKTKKGIEILHIIKKGQLKHDNDNNQTIFRQFTSTSSLMPKLQILLIRI